MKVILLAGGSGTRLWPLSRKKQPKQFNKLFDNSSLYQETLKRNSGSSFIVVTNKLQAILVKEQTAELGISDISVMLEPVGRNTAPAIALACFSLKKDDIVLVSPCDHYISKTDEYQFALDQAVLFAEAGNLVTFGIKPTEPEVGYGYIETNGNDVLSFKEKPFFSTAKKYLQKDNFYWNSGMFVFKAGVFLEELQKLENNIYQKAKETYDARLSIDSDITFDYDLMVSIPASSIDYAVMERSKKVKCVPADIDWSDLGSFDALHDILEKDKNSSSIQGDVLSLESHNNLIINNSNTKIVTIGLKNLMIINTGDALLISRLDESQKIKDVVDELKKTSEELT